MVDNSTKKTLKKKNKNSALKTLFVLLILLLFLSFMVILLFVFDPEKRAIASPLDTPSNVSVVETDTGNQNNKTYTLNFDRVDNADYYAVYIFKSLQQAQDAVNSDFATASSAFSFNGTTKDISTYMTEKGEYYFAVQAICKRIPSYSSAPSNPLDCKHIVYYYLDAPTLKVDLIRGVEDVYECSWSSVNDAQSYELDILTSSNMQSILSETLILTGNNYTISSEILDIMNNYSTTDFTVKVRALSSSEFTKSSQWATAETNTFKTIQTPTLNYVYQVESNVETHKLTWDNVAFANFYEIYLNEQLISTIDAPQTEIDISSFVTNIGEYTAKIIGCNNSPFVTNSQSATTTFKVYATTPTVTGLIVERRGEEIAVAWNVDEYPSTYKIYIKDRDGNPVVKEGSEDFLLGNESGFVTFPMTWNMDGYYEITIEAKRNSEYYYASDKISKVFEFTTKTLSAPTVTFNENTKTLIWEPQADISGNPNAYDNNGYKIQVWSENEQGDKIILYSQNTQREKNKWLQYTHKLDEFFSTQPAGFYYASVQALGGYLIWTDSVESEKVECKHTLELDTPLNVKIIDSGTSFSDTNPEFCFDVVENAVAYKVLINDVEEIDILVNGGAYEVSEGYTVQFSNGVISLKGLDTFFNSQGTGDYGFKVKAIADTSERSVYKDSQWSDVQTYHLDKVLKTPQIIESYQDIAGENNMLFIRWNSIDDLTSEKIYDETKQYFNIYVNGSKISSLAAPNLTVTVGGHEYYQYDISSYLIPGTKNEVQVEAESYDSYDGSISEKYDVTYHYFLSKGISVSEAVKIAGEVDQNTNELSYYLLFNNSKYANKYTFTFADVTDENNSIVQNVYRSGVTGISTKVNLNEAWITPYGKTQVQVNFSFDNTLENNNLEIQDEYIHDADFIYEFTDDARLPPVENLSFDNELEKFTWDYNATALNGISHFTYSYYFTNSSQSAKTGTFAKDDFDESKHQGVIAFENAGEIKFSLTPISSSIKRKNGDTVTITCNVVATLQSPKDIAIKNVNNSVYIEFSPVKNVLASEAYTVELYERSDDGTLVQVGQTLVVGNSSNKIKVYLNSFGASFDDKKVFVARAKANAHSPISGGGYFYKESEWAETADFEFVPVIEKPLISLNSSDLIIYKVKHADTYDVYLRTSRDGENKTNITKFFTNITDSLNSRILDLTDYFNPLNTNNGTYYLSVIASNSSWNTSSEESLVLEYNYMQRFNIPEKLEASSLGTTFSAKWSKVSGDNFGEEVKPTGYKLVVGSSNRSYPRLFTLEIIANGDSFDFVVKGEKANLTSQEAGVLTFDKGILRFNENDFELSYTTPSLNEKSKYVVDITVLGNEEKYFANSFEKSVEFIAYSTCIDTPTISFENNTNYQTSDSEVIIYITKEGYSQTFNLKVTNLFTGEVINDVAFENQSSLDYVVSGKTYKKFNLDKLLLKQKGIYEIQVKYNANKSAGAGESDYSNKIHLYHSIPLSPISNLELTSQMSGTSSPVKITIKLPTSQITDEFNGFDLTINTTEDTPQTTKLKLGMTGSFGYDRQDNKNTGISTITYQIPISAIKGFGSVWSTLDYDFEFNVQVSAYNAQTNLISTYGLPANYLDAYVFDKNSISVKSILNTSKQTATPGSIYLDQELGRIGWSGISAKNVVYSYIYYAWDLTNNTYTLYGKNVEKDLTLSGESLQLDGLNLSNIPVGDKIWFTTTNNYFNIANYTQENNNTIYGVYIYAQADGLTASNITTTTCAKNPVEPTLDASDITLDDRLEWKDVYGIYSDAIFNVDNNNGGYYKDTKYIVYINGERLNLDSLSAEQNTKYINGRVSVSVNIRDIGGGNSITVQIIAQTLDTVAVETKLEHRVLLETIVDTSVFLPTKLEGAVTGVNVIWDETKSVCQANWQHIDKATKYNLILTTDSVTFADMNELAGNFVEGENNVLGIKTVPTSELDINNIMFDITDWVKQKLAVGKYKLWVCVADDAENNVVSSETFAPSSGADLIIYDVALSAENLKYNFTDGANRVKTFSWTSGSYTKEDSTPAYQKSVYKLELFDIDGNKVSFYIGSSGEPVYQLYFKHSSVTDTTAFSGKQIEPLSLSGQNVVIDVTYWFERIDAGDYVAKLTICPASSTASVSQSNPSEIYIQNNRKLELQDVTYMNIVVDSYIESVDHNGEVIYKLDFDEVPEPVKEHLKNSIFNNKVIELLNGLPVGAEGFGVVVYKDGKVINTKEFYYNNDGIFTDLSLSLDEGVYTLGIYAIGDDKRLYYSNSDVKTDIENLDVYKRHMIDDETGLKAEISRDANGYITSVKIPHGISVADTSFVVYCFKKVVDASGNEGLVEVWNTKDNIKNSLTKITVSNQPYVEIYGDILEHANVMTMGEYVFKIKWLATDIEEANKILDSDVNETTGVNYLHTTEIKSPELLIAENGSNVFVERDDEGYVTQVEARWGMINPSIESIVKYEFEMMNFEKENIGNYKVFVKITYGWNKSASAFVPVYEIMPNSGTYQSDEEFVIEDNILKFDMLSYIKASDYVAGNYYFNLGITQFTKYNSTNENIEIIESFSPVWTFNNNNPSMYLHQDVYATINDKWQIDNGGNNLYISDITIDINTNSPNYGLLSWNFHDNPTFAKANYFELTVNGNVFIVQYKPSKTSYNFDLKAILWADNDPMANINDVSIKLVTTDENWFETPSLNIISSTVNTIYDEDNLDKNLAEASLFGFEFIWQTNLGVGGNILNNSWKTGSQDVYFEYEFNNYYAQDGRLYSDPAMSQTEVEFSVEVLYSKQDIRGSTFESLKDSSLIERSLNISQSQIEDWINFENSGKDFMTFNVGRQNSGAMFAYNFNLQNLINYIDSSWLFGGDLVEGYYYININLVDDANGDVSPYLNGSLWSEAQFVQAPWRIDGTKIVDGNQSDPTLILNNQTPTDAEKQKWADNEKSVSLEFTITKVKGTMPNLYSILAYYKSVESASEYERILTRAPEQVLIVSETSEQAVVRIDISDMFNEGGVLSGLSGLHSFRVIAKGTDNAKDSTLNSSIKIAYENALQNYVRLNKVNVADPSAVPEESKLVLNWEWDFPESYTADGGNLKIQPTLEINNYKKGYSGERYGNDEFIIIGLDGYSNITTSLLSDKTVAGAYTHTFNVNGSNLNIQRSLSSKNPIMNYITYKVVVPNGEQFKFMLNSEITEQEVFYVSGYRAPIDPTIKNRYDSDLNQYVYIPDDETNYNNSYHEISFVLDTESFANIENNQRYSFVQMRAYSRDNREIPMNGTNGIILKVCYNATANTGEQISGVYVYNPETKTSVPVANFGVIFSGVVDLTNATSVSVLLDRVPLAWIFGDSGKATIPDVYNFKFNIYIPFESGEENLNKSNSVAEPTLINNVRMQTPVIESVRFENLENDDILDIGSTNGNPYLRYTGQDSNFNILISLSNVSPNAYAVYLTVSSVPGASQDASQTQRFVIHLKDADGNFLEGVTANFNESTQSYDCTILISRLYFETYFENVLSLIPNKLYFFAQAINFDIGYYNEIKTQDGIFKERISVGPTYVDSFRSDAKIVSVYRELANPEFSFGFEVINGKQDFKENNGESDEINDVIEVLNDTITNLIKSGDDYQVANPYAVVYASKYQAKNKNFNNQTTNLLANNVNFRIELSYGASKTNIDKTSSILMSENIGANFNLYDDLSKRVQKEQGKIITITIYAEKAKNAGADYYWINQDLTNEQNRSVSKNIMFYHNVAVRANSVAVNSLTFSNEETKWADSNQRTGLLKPSNIPLTWMYDNSGAKQSATGFKITIYRGNSENVAEIKQQVETVTSAEGINLVSDVNTSQDWLYPNFNFDNWANITGDGQTGVWKISVQPYYKLANGNSVYGTSASGNFQMKLKLSSLRDIATTYAFSRAFLNVLDGGLADANDSYTTSMIRTEPTIHNSGNPAVIVERISSDAFGSNYLTNSENVTRLYCNGFTLDVNGKQLASTSLGLTEFSPENFIATLNKLMDQNKFHGGQYQIRYKLNSQSTTIASDWSQRTTLVYCKAYDGSGFRVDQTSKSNDYITATLSSDVKDYRLSETFSIVQRNYSNSRREEEVLRTTRGSTTVNLDDFSPSRLDALTISDATESNISTISSKCVRGYVYDSSNLGYIQLGSNTIKVVVEYANDSTYNVGYFATDSANFYMPDQYPSIKEPTQKDGVSLKEATVTYAGFKGKFTCGPDKVMKGDKLVYEVDKKRYGSTEAYINKTITRHFQAVYEYYISAFEIGTSPYNYKLSANGVANLVIQNGKISWEGDEKIKAKNISVTVTLKSPVYLSYSGFSRYGLQEKISSTFEIKALPDSTSTKTQTLGTIKVSAQWTGFRSEDRFGGAETYVMGIVMFDTETIKGVESKGVMEMYIKLKGNMKFLADRTVDHKGKWDKTEDYIESFEWSSDGRWGIISGDTSDWATIEERWSQVSLSISIDSTNAQEAFDSGISII